MGLGAAASARAGGNANATDAAEPAAPVSNFRLVHELSIAPLRNAHALDLRGAIFQTFNSQPSRLRFVNGKE